MTTPHKHAEVIKAWADGAKIECRGPKSPDWIDSTDPQWFESHYYRVKPEETETIYPGTMMSDEELRCCWSLMSGNKIDALRGFAGSVLIHACDNGQVVTREEFDRAIAERDKRDIEVIKATGRFLNKHFLTDLQLSWQKITVNFHEFHFLKIAEMLKESK